MEGPFLCFGMDGGKAESIDMVRSAGLIQQNVPVGPGNGAIVEIMDHILAVLFAPLPLAESLPAEGIIAGFGQQQVGFREGFGYPFNIFILTAAIPDFIPMKSDPLDIFGCIGITQQGGGPLEQQVAVVVPGDEFLAAQFVGVQGGPEIILDKVALLLCRKHTAFPDLPGHGLILYRQSPHRHASLIHCLDVFDIIVGPGLEIFRFQSASRLHGLFDQRDFVLFIMCDAEGVGVGTLPPALIIYGFSINGFIQINIREIRVARNKSTAG